MDSNLMSNQRHNKVIKTSRPIRKLLKHDFFPDVYRYTVLLIPRCFELPTVTVIAVYFMADVIGGNSGFPTVYQIVTRRSIYCKNNDSSNITIYLIV